MTKQDFWSKDPTREQMLREMIVIPGASARTIAVALGCSRNAVIAKVHRLGLRFTNRPGQSAAHLGAAAPRPVRQMPAPPKKTKPSVLSIFRQARPPTSVESYGPFRAVPIWDLEDAHCRAPIGNPLDSETFRYCGAPVSAGKSYCRTHFQEFTTPIVRATRSSGRWS